MDWGALAAVAAFSSAAGAILARLIGGAFGHGKHTGTSGAQIAAINAICTNALQEIKIVAEKLHQHEISDAAAFSELRASLAALSRDQVGVETRIFQQIDAMREDVRNGAQDRFHMIGELRNEMRGVNERIDRILSERTE